jgi:hypothetical protein
LRTDLKEALDAAPAKARRVLAMRRYRKLLQELESGISTDEEIVALVASLPPENTISHSSIYNIGGRLLVVTSMAVYHVLGKVVGSAEYIQIPLSSIYAPPRVTIRREALSLGKQVVRLAIDEQRGGNVETRVFMVDGEESAADWIRDSIITETESLRAEIDTHEERQLQQAMRAAVRDANSSSIADELAKLADLRDQGVLTDDEFAQQKQRLLEN